MKGANRPRNDMTRKQANGPHKHIKRKNPGKAERHGKSKVWYEVSCDVHGMDRSGGREHKILKVEVPKPYSRHMRFEVGCPICRGA